MGSTGQEITLPIPQGWEECCTPNTSVPTVQLDGDDQYYLTFEFQADHNPSSSVGDWFLERARGSELQYTSHALGLSLGTDFDQSTNTYFPKELHFAFGVDLSLTMKDGEKLFCPGIILGQGEETATTRLGLDPKEIEESGLNVADGNWIGAIFDFAAEIVDVLPFKIDENNWWAAQDGMAKEIYKTTVLVEKIPPTPNEVVPAILIQCSDSDGQVVYGKLYEAGPGKQFDHIFTLNLNWPKAPPIPPSSWPAGSWICSCNTSEGLTWDGSQLCANCQGSLQPGVPSCARDCQSNSFTNSNGALACDEGHLPPGRWQCQCDGATWDGEKLCATCRHDRTNPKYSCQSGCNGFDAKDDLLVCDDLFP